MIKNAPDSSSLDWFHRQEVDQGTTKAAGEILRNSSYRGTGHGRYSQANESIFASQANEILRNLLAKPGAYAGD